MQMTDVWPDPPDGFEYGIVNTKIQYQELLALIKRIHEEEDAQMLSRLIEKLPGFGLENNIFLRDSSSKEMVACLNAIPSSWSYEGIGLRNLELGFVGTLEEYRKKGLFQSLYRIFEIELEHGGYDLTTIQGIPFFYRQYGYDFMIPLDRYVRIKPHNIPSEMNEGIEDIFQIRKAQSEDLYSLMKMYEETTEAFMVCAQRSKELWKAQEKTMMFETEHFVTQIIESNSEACGYFRMTVPHKSKHTKKEKILNVFETSVLSEACSIMLFHHIRNYCLRNGINEIRFPGTTALYPSRLALSLGGRMSRGWKHQIRIPNLARFLQQVSPVFERRLDGTPFESLSRRVEINTYRNLYSLDFQKGKVINVNAHEKPRIGYGGMLRSPPSRFVRLLLGANTLNELEHFDADFVVEKRYRSLIETLFPQKQSYIFYYFC